MQALKQNKGITRSASYLCCCFVLTSKIKMTASKIKMTDFITFMSKRWTFTLKDAVRNLKK